jgi:hypothetical protein
MSEGSRFLDFARNDKTQNFLWRHFHRAEVYFPIDASQERFDWAAVLIGLSEAAPDAVASASVASAKTGLLRTKFHHLGNALAFVLRSSAAGDMTWFQSIPGHEKLWGDAALRAC